MLVDARAVGPTLVVNEIDVLRVPAGRAGKTAAARAAEMAASVQAWDGHARPQAKAEGGAWRVVLGSRTVFTPTAADAAALRSRADELARSVAARIGDALEAGKLRSDIADTVLPPDRSARFELVGSEARKSSVRVWPKEVAKVVRSQGAIQIVPVSTGEATLVVTGASTERRAAVRVRPYAPSPPARVAVRVTGQRPDPGLVAAAVRGAVIGSMPSAKLTQLDAELRAPMPGESASGTVRFKVEATDRFAREAVVGVSAFNPAASLTPESALLYSNDPEDLAQPGPLYEYTLVPGMPARLLWHHKNATWVPLVVEYFAVNEGPDTARLWLTVGESEAHSNPTFAGYKAAEQFLDQWLTGSAAEVTVPAGSAVAIAALRCASTETVSGLARLEARHGQLRIVGRAVRADSWNPVWRQQGAGAMGWARLPALPASDLGLARAGVPRHVYPLPFRAERFQYEVGGRFGFVRIGEKAIPDTAGQGVLHGNFGVVYSVEGSLANPTSSPAEVEVVLEASAGYAGALFELEGRIVRAGMLQSKQEFVLCNVKLPPGASRTLKFRTLPLSGANYPVTVIVRPVGIER